jgi:hypothetical protein
MRDQGLMDLTVLLIVLTPLSEWIKAQSVALKAFALSFDKPSLTITVKPQGLSFCVILVLEVAHWPRLGLGVKGDI